ncbi:MAG TPA: LuxR C-terminal-related transcriptional regulator [Jiangellales bacterium]|nr:LuxR C-terminal-related transcriptional regulator [Jiangellales bacterium]
MDLLSTKIHAPRPRRSLVTRDRLVERLAGGAGGRLTLVSAPAGWGKTTAVLEWQRCAPGTRRFAWVSLDVEDSDPTRFWSYVVRSLATALPHGLEEPLRLARAGADPAHVLLPTLVNALSETVADRVVLVLDDYHEVASATVDRQLGFLVDHLPPTLHVVVISRTRPALPLARLRSRGELAEVRAADLRFSRAETAALLVDVLGLGLSTQDVAALQRRTEGWVAALQLAALSISTRATPSAPLEAFSGPHDHLVDYLAAEVLGGLPPELRSFVVRTSVLERLTAPLCDAVTGRDDSALLLDEADRRNLFLVALDDRREWYRYHHLFADALRDVLRRESPDDVPRLHRRAARWYEARGAASEAVRHAVAGGDRAGLRRVVSQHWNATYNHGRLATVGGWLDALGEADVRADAWLAAARVMVWADEGRLDELDAWIDDDHGRTVDGYPYALVRALHRFKSGDLARASDELVAAARLRDDAKPFWPTVERCLRAAVACWLGDYQSCRREAAAAATLAGSYGNVAGRTYALGYLALACLDEGDAPAARRRLDQVGDQLRPGSDLSAHFALTLPLLVAGRLHRLAGRPDAAVADLERAVSISRLGAGRLERVAALSGLVRALEESGRRADAATLRDEAAALVRACAVPGRVATLLADDPRVPRPRLPGTGEKLTAREAAVLRLLPTRKSLRDIAADLFVSHNTVKTHTRSLYRKLAVSTREEAVGRARDAGLL